MAVNTINRLTIQGYKSLANETSLELRPLTILAGLQPPSTGEVFLFGKKIKDYTQKEMQQMRANRIGFVFQTFYLIDSLTALENILLVLKFNRIHGDRARDRAMDLLSRYEVQYLARTYPLTMSQGEKQRVALARALANDPELIIADEPTGSLATSQGMKIVEFLHESAHQDDRCVIIARQDHLIAGFADRVIYLREGVLIP